MREAATRATADERADDFSRTLPDGSDLPRLSNDVLQRLLPTIPVGELFNNYTAFLAEYGGGTDECLPRALPCDHTTRYRSPSGWCNNLKHPEFGERAVRGRGGRENDEPQATPSPRSITS